MAEDREDKIHKILQTVGGIQKGSAWRDKRDDLSRQRAAGEFEIDRIVPGQTLGGENGGFYLVRRDFPLDTLQGNVALGAAREAIAEHVSWSACDPELETFDPMTAVFIDLETTGLTGGTGTIAFLAGIGYFTEDAFRLEQCFMRDFDEEETMLGYLDGLFRRAETVVTFNGKTFDLPLLRTRFIANRRPFRLDAALHFDLIHAVRRIWKLRLKDCSLGNVERAVLGITRRGDVPSAEIPQIWFDYLRTRDARRLKPVFYHHQMDVLSLVALTALLSQRLGAPAAEAFDYAEDRLSLARLHFRQRRFQEAAGHAQTLLEASVPASVRRACLELLGFACKRAGDFDRMERAWDRMMREFPHDLLPRLELAKHYEHRTRNLLEAQHICEETIKDLDAQAALGYTGGFENIHRNHFQRRLERIQRKLAKHPKTGGGEQPDGLI